MSKSKTISGHSDKAYNIDHNNRSFIPKNVDQSRIPWNYNCVAAGQGVYFDPTEPLHISEFWARYREVNSLYRSDRTITQTLAYERYQEHLQYMRRISQPLCSIPHNPVAALITLLLLHQNAKAEWEQFKEEQWIQKEIKNAMTGIGNTRALIPEGIYPRRITKFPGQKNV